MAAWFRSLLYMAALSNVIGSYLFSPFGSLVRRRIALPIADSLYLTSMALWMLLVALLLFYLARMDMVNRLLILLIALMKLGFGLLLLQYYLSAGGTLLVLEMCLIVLYLAGALLFWLIQSFRAGQQTNSSEIS